MPKLDLDTIPQTNATGYPPPFDAPVQGRWYRRLAPPSGLTDFGVSHVVLKPCTWSSQRHWHIGEDEFLVMLAGEAVLIDGDGEHELRPGDCASFPKNDGNSHHLQNRTERECRFVVVGGGTDLGGSYPDIDMRWTADNRYVHRDRSEYDTERTA